MSEAIAPDGATGVPSVEPPAARRRQHTKSRNGCAQCKERKVKCDEVKPRCGGCARFCIACTFIPPPAPSAAPVEKTAARRKRGRPRKDWGTIKSSASPTTNAHKLVASPSVMTDSSVPPVDSSGLNMDDLHLLHNFLFCSASLFGDDVWCQRVVPLGFEFPMILHLALALSALQLEKSQPDGATKYRELADSHFDKGLRLVKNLMPSIAENNYTALYFSTILVCCVTFAKGPTQGCMMTAAEDYDVTWCYLLRGVRLVIDKMGLDMADRSVIPGRESELVDLPISRPVLWETPLRRLWNLLSEAPGRDKSIYSHVLDDLAEGFLQTFGPGNAPTGSINGKMQVVMAWLYRLEDNFVSLLQEKEPISLIIMAHFAVLLNTLEHFWFIKGWAAHIVSQVSSMLDNSYASWVCWPREEVNIVGELRRQLVATKGN